MTQFQRKRIQQVQEDIEKMSQKVEMATDSGLMNLVGKLVESKYTAAVIWGIAAVVFVFALWLIFG